jgi:NAD(P) transhydrogenase subunit alpha
MADQDRPIVVGVPKESYPGERRVAVVPDIIPVLSKAGAEVWIEGSAGLEAGFSDEDFTRKGAHLGNRDDILSKSEVVFQVRTYGANSEVGRADLANLKKGQIVIGLTESLSEPGLSKELADTGVTLFSLELLPRITRAQSMDVLSSMATIAGYKAVILAAGELRKIFPMFMTAAGTITPARVFVVGAGVAGLQAVATAKRLGAVVSAYDVRPAVKEQVQSLGGRFVELELEAGEAEDAGGYAKAMGEEFYKKQRVMMTEVVAQNDVVVTTAAVPGKKAPILITKEMVQGMSPGSVIVDLAAERGGNCELTQAGESIEVGGVTIMGPMNLPATVPAHASQMYSKNITTFFLNIVKDGAINLDLEDEITRDTMVTRQGNVVSPRVRELLGLSRTEAVEGR